MLRRPHIPCPRCGEVYEQARGRSPEGIIYRHPDGRECIVGRPLCPVCSAVLEAEGAACRSCSQSVSRTS